MRIAVGIAVAVGLGLGLARPQAATAGVVVLIPPLEVELGRATTLAPNQTAASEPQILIGLSWASVFPDRTPLDVSVGLVVIGEDEDAPAPAAARAVAAPGPTTGWFVAAELRAAEGRYWRSWIGARGERLSLGDEVGLGGFARMSTEVWFGAAGGDGHGVVFGAAAITLWAEAGLRERASGSAAPVVAAGMGVRIPFLFFAGS